MSRTVRLSLALLFALMMVIATASAALALEPPGNEPADLFTCVDGTTGSPVPGFPGHKGMAHAFNGTDKLAAWNAVFTEPGVPRGNPVMVCVSPNPGTG